MRHLYLYMRIEKGRAMKKWVLIVLLVGAAAWGIFEPVEPKPEPIEVKPVLVNEAEPWVIGKTTVAYYQKVTMPDGTRQELKSRTPLSKAQWQALAEKVYVKPEPLPEACSRCGGTGFEP
jgi:hypothetical protein